MTETGVTTVLEPRLGWLQSWLPWLRWTPTSPQELEQAEERLLAFSSLKSTGHYVQAGDSSSIDMMRIMMIIMTMVMILKMMMVIMRKILLMMM